MCLILQKNNLSGMSSIPMHFRKKKQGRVRKMNGEQKSAQKGKISTLFKKEIMDMAARFM
jgi:hypothetical protein